MKQILFCLCIIMSLLACNQQEKTTENKESKAASSVTLPYTAEYTSNWSDDVSDEDLAMVLTTYKHWSEGNLDGLAASMADTVELNMASGTHGNYSNADLKKMWGTYRDSLSKIEIKMETWRKMHAVDKKESYVVTWYKEYDTYKDGRIDSAEYHDINMIKDGKIKWYSTFKQPLK